jgi:hypothetical protein
MSILEKERVLGKVGHQILLQLRYGERFVGGAKLFFQKQKSQFTR